MAAMRRLLGRSCHLFTRCATTTAEAPLLWYVSHTTFTARQPMVEHGLAISTRRSDLRRVICTPVESWRVQRPRVVVYGAGEAALDNSGQ